MKKVLVAIAAMWGLSSCFAGREMQGEMMNAELIKIDTIYRYPAQQQLLTWKCSRNTEYITYASLNTPYTVGSKMTVIVSR